MAEPKKPTTTEFNSSVAVLMRIDRLIKEAHLSYQGLFTLTYQVPGNDSEFYLLALDRLFMECQTMMDDTEIKECKAYRNRIIIAKNKWIHAIERPIIYDETDNTKRANMGYKRAWIEIKEIARSYEIYLMQVMRNHGLLLTEKGLAEQGVFE